MKHILITSAVAFGLMAAGSTTMAQSISDQVISALQAEGYSRIEVKNGLNQVKVEAIRGNRELEVVYDARTGAILKQEVNRLRDGQTVVPGVQVRTERRDFVSARNNDDDDRGLGGNGYRFDDDDDYDDDRGRGRDRADDDDDDDDDDRGRGRGRDRADDDDDDRDDDRGRGRGRDRADDDDDDRDGKGRGRGRGRGGRDDGRDDD